VKAGLELNEMLTNVLLFILVSHRRTQLKPSAKVDKKYMPHEKITIEKGKTEKK
jgi:hypothetical protein